MSKAESVSASKLLILLCVILLFIFLVRLGFWQLDRAEQKTQLLAQWDKPAITVQLPLNEKVVDFYQKVTVKGKIQSSEYYLLDNKIRDGKVGYEVLVVLTVQKNQTLLINLGWVIANTDRNILPVIKLPSTALQLSGWFKKVEKAFQLKADAWPQSWPKRIQQIDFTKIKKVKGETFSNTVLLVENPLIAGLKTQWQPINMSVEKHIGYAIQWFLMAFSLCIMMLWFIFFSHTDESA